MRPVLALLVILLAFSWTGCKKPPAPPPTPSSSYPTAPPQPVYTPPPPVEWRYEKDGIRLRLVSDPRLNFFQGSATTLLVCVYNLRDPNAFNQLAGEREGLTKLLECGRFDPSVTSTKRIVVQPGQEVNEAMDRAEGAKYVGLVAGYYSLQKEKAVRLFPVPLMEEKKGVVFTTKSSYPAILNIDLYLGEQAIQEPKGK